MPPLLPTRFPKGTCECTANKTGPLRRTEVWRSTTAFWARVPDWANDGWQPDAAVQSLGSSAAEVASESDVAPGALGVADALATGAVEVE